MKIQFKARIWKQGTSCVITIPADFVKHNLVDETKEYYVTIQLTEVKP